MKRLLIITVIVLLIGVHACDKKDEQIEFPIWLQQKIELIAANPETCKLYNIMIAEYNGSNYYIIQSAISSCIYCDIYDESGVKPVWIENAWTDFSTNMKIIKSQTVCQ